jgi:hypothetical protein
MRSALTGASPAAGAVLHYSAAKTICSCDSMCIAFAVGSGVRKILYNASWRPNVVDGPVGFATHLN